MKRRVGFGSFDVDVDPLMIFGCIGEVVDARLVYLKPIAYADLLTDEILELFDQLVDQGKTIILVTHDPTVAHRCRRVITLHDGRVLKDERGARYAVNAEAGQLLDEGASI